VDYYCSLNQVALHIFEIHRIQAAIFSTNFIVVFEKKLGELMEKCVFLL